MIRINNVINEGLVTILNKLDREDRILKEINLFKKYDRLIEIKRAIGCNYIIDKGIIVTLKVDTMDRADNIKHNNEIIDLDNTRGNNSIVIVDLCEQNKVEKLNIVESIPSNKGYIGFKVEVGYQFISIVYIIYILMILFVF